MQSKVITVISSVVSLAQFVPALPAKGCCGWGFALPFETKMTVFALLTFRISIGCVLSADVVGKTANVFLVILSVSGQSWLLS